LYAIWQYDNHIDEESGNMVIEEQTLLKTSFVKVMENDVIIDGTDDNWSSYLPNIKTMRHYNRGVFTADNSGNVRKIKLSPYCISKYEVTRALFNSVMKKDFDSICSRYVDAARERSFTDNSEWSEKDNCAMNFISWFDTIAFCNKLSLLMGKTPCYTVEGIDNWENLSYYAIPDNTADSMYSKWAAVTVNMSANGYRLPTEAEWEFAARGGDQSQDDWKYAFAGVQSSGNAYDSDNGYLKDDANLEDYGWFGRDSNHSIPIHVVGKKNGNRLDIYDMSGNLYEWCWDIFNTPYNNDAAYMANGVIVNPLGAGIDPYGGINRSYRGGAVNCEAGFCTVSYRTMGSIYTRSLTSGFRLAQTVTE
ncbi:MAG: SUMF1/EgtB/PvdO family nonheme iron enzyme, partial [Spirochaetales bacterium]|nr:SUMF1/EgtB/PvdO family nonheme iron enzyme [Spirochaetales bacterium]